MGCIWVDVDWRLQDTLLICEIVGSMFLILGVNICK